MTGYVYFIRRDDDTGPIKIGYSKTPERRAYEMSFADRPKLKVMAKATGLFRDEGLLHQMFAHVRVEGEWFEPVPELLALIEDIEATGEPPSFFFRAKIAA